MKNTTALLYAILLLVAFSGCAKSRETPARTVAIAAKRFEFTPAEIRLKRGELVAFHIISSDVQHSFEVKDLHISEPIGPGKPAVFTFRPEQNGTFTIECGILCGPMHDEMRAKLIVE